MLISPTSKQKKSLQPLECVQILTKWMTGAGQVCLISSVQESQYTQEELAAPPHQTQPYLGLAVRHRLQSDRPAEQLNRVTEIRVRNGTLWGNHINLMSNNYTIIYNTIWLLYVIKLSHTHMHRVLHTETHTRKNTLWTVPTIQILSAVDEEVVFSPHVDHDWVFLHQGRIGKLKQEQQLTVKPSLYTHGIWVDVMNTHVQRS